MHIRPTASSCLSLLALLVLLSCLPTKAGPLLGDKFYDPLADIEPEESFLKSLDKADTSSPGTGRRTSASGAASRLKERNLIPPLHTPTGRRTSLPRASKSVLIQGTSAQRVMPTDKNNGAQTPKTTEPGTAFLDRMENMFKNLREDIAKSETNTGRKIDDLSAKLSSRLTKAEADLTRVGAEVATTRTELCTLKEKLGEQERALPDMVELAVARKFNTRSAELDPLAATGRRPRQLGAAREDQTEKEEKYWDARASLRMWPVIGDDMALAVLDFLVEKLRCPPRMVDVTDIVAIVKVVPRPDAFAQDQVVVRFSSVRLRDEVKSLSKNLDGTDKLTGIQIEPPDFLRTQYQTFQRLAYQMKKKHPSLKRSVRFLDSDFCLTMNVLTSREAQWRTIAYEDAKVIMKKTRERTDSISRRELEEMVDVDGSRKKRRRTLTDSESSDMEDDNDVTIVENNVTGNNNKSKPSRRSITFINANCEVPQAENRVTL